jgi:HAE1 family hydrophobic/amphiphilic exporter-1
LKKRGSVTGLNFIANASASNYGIGFIHMKPQGKRGKVEKVEAVMGVINQQTQCDQGSADISFPVSYSTGIW